jgi:hypothetical protein
MLVKSMEIISGIKHNNIVFSHQIVHIWPPQRVSRRSIVLALISVPTCGWWSNKNIDVDKKVLHIYDVITLVRHFISCWSFINYVLFNFIMECPLDRESGILIRHSKCCKYKFSEIMSSSNQSIVNKRSVYTYHGLKLLNEFMVI